MESLSHTSAAHVFIYIFRLKVEVLSLSRRSTSREETLNVFQFGADLLETMKTPGQRLLFVSRSNSALNSCIF